MNETEKGGVGGREVVSRNPLNSHSSLLPNHPYHQEDIKDELGCCRVSGTLPPGGKGGEVSPLNTPSDWHTRIATRQREWATLGPEAAMTLWHARGECSTHVRDAMLAHIAAERAAAARTNAGQCGG